MLDCQSKAAEKFMQGTERLRMEHDPLTVADRLRWAREWWKEDHRQPADLDKLLLRAAETLERTVPAHWRVIAVLEAVVLIVAAVGLHMTSN